MKLAAIITYYLGRLACRRKKKALQEQKVWKLKIRLHSTFVLMPHGHKKYRSPLLLFQRIQTVLDGIKESESLLILIKKRPGIRRYFEVFLWHIRSQTKEKVVLFMVNCGLRGVKISDRSGQVLMISLILSCTSVPHSMSLAYEEYARA